MDPDNDNASKSVPPPEKQPSRWRRILPTVALSGILVVSAFLSDFRLDRRIGRLQSEQQQFARSLDSFRQSQNADVRSHAERDEEITDLLLSMIPEVRTILAAIERSEKERSERTEENEKRLAQAWNLLQDSKRLPKDDPLDCRRVHTLMVEIGDRADAITRFQIERNPNSRKLSRIAVPLERIQTKASRGTMLAWKEFGEHSGVGNRTKNWVDAADLIAALLEEAGALVKLAKNQSNSATIGG